jgi:hypothetical protein
MLGAATQAAVLAVLPFLVLIRGAVLLEQALAWNAWFSIGLAAVVTTSVLSYYVFRLWRIISHRSGYVWIATRVVAPIMLVFCIVSLSFLADANAKDARVHGTYRELHPALRLALASLCLVDDDVVLTDIRRTPAEYPRMGLPVAARSLHYAQPDGFVHAIDLRTRGRGLARNLLTQAWFLGLGFETVRHDGSADHLHVSLPSPSPG